MDTRQLLRKEIETIPDTLLEEILRFVKALKGKESACINCWGDTSSLPTSQVLLGL